MISLAMVLALLPAGAAAKDKPRKPTPAGEAASYPLHDSHDGITVAAEPGDVAEARPDTRLDYYHHGFLPVRVVVSNGTARPLSLDDTRMLFIAGDNYTRNAATEDELDRRLFNHKDAAGKTIPLPAPLPSIKLHGPQLNKQIAADEDDFGFPSTTVAPHSTASGYLFYDTRDVDEPVLEHATLELRKVRWADTNKELDSFEIALKPSTAKPAKTGESK